MPFRSLRAVSPPNAQSDWSITEDADVAVNERGLPLATVARIETVVLRESIMLDAVENLYYM
jgi:hypothetical protein